MKLRLLSVLTLGAWLVPQPEVASQEPARPAPGVFSADTGVVVLDVVVRDKKGRAVRDLQGSEVDIYEDGVKQSLTGFRLVEVAPRAPVPDSPSSAAAGEPPKATESSSPLNLFTLLFDQLGAAGQALARQAALEFLDLPPRPGQYISVFSVGNRLELVQQFTSDRALLKKAVET
ncbi:MAG TPA: VWA domain-containing protein, partial [Vicinamibacteria bacterium]|nr:VWA domain-containing protein [Vicinamibacteria bacterium]